MYLLNYSINALIIYTNVSTTTNYDLFLPSYAYSSLLFLMPLWLTTLL